MRPKENAAVLEARRRRAVSLLEEGLGIRAVARQVGSSPSSVKRWKEVVEKSGAEALVSRPNPGRPSRLSVRQREKLLKLLLKGAIAQGYMNNLWTLRRVSQVIEDHFGIHYHPAHVWKILRGCGWVELSKARAPRQGEKRSRD